MSDSGRLRYASVSDMPEAMGKRVIAQGKDVARAHLTPADTGQCKPHRDDEHQEQVELFKRIRDVGLLDDRYAVAARRTFAIPNGGGRTKREGGRLKAEGVTAGVSDIFCSVARGGHHGLYIEMKSLIGALKPDQRAWINESITEGYAATTCRGAAAAFNVWMEYING